MTQSVKRPFCGREDELAILREAYRDVAPAKGKPRPRVITLLGESGLGKTRLVQQFYHWLSTNIDEVGGAGYWPDALPVSDNYRDINPIEPCNFSAPLPYLWLGVACRDQIMGMETYASKLTPHLVSLEKARARREWSLGAARKGGELAAEFIPGGKPALQLWKAARDGHKAVKVWRRDRKEMRDGTGRHAQVDRQTSDNLLEQLSRFLDAPTSLVDAAGAARQIDRAASGLRRVPLVIVVDDAQWAGRSPALLDFLDALVDAAHERTWPLLLIATHWEREWNQDRQSDAPSFAKRAVRWQREWPAACRSISVTPQRGLTYEPVVEALLPGLSEVQHKAILARADGNVRLLEEIVHHALINERYFENRDTRGPLTAEGLAQLCSHQFNLHGLVAQRLASAPRHIRVAVSLSALQGYQFLGGVTASLAERLGKSLSDTSLKESEKVYGLTAHVERDLHEFSQLAYHDVAAADLANIADAESAGQTLGQILTEMISDEGALAEMDYLERFELRSISADVLRRSPDIAVRVRAVRCLFAMACESSERLDYVTAIALIEDALSLDGAVDALEGRTGWEELHRLVEPLVEMKRSATARRLLTALWMAETRVGRPQTMNDLSSYQVFFTAVAKQDGAGVPDDLYNDAEIEDRLRDLYLEHGEESARTLAALGIEMSRLSDAVKDSVASGDLLSELNARTAELKYRVDLAKRSSVPLGHTPFLNDLRLELAGAIRTRIDLRGEFDDPHDVWPISASQNLLAEILDNTVIDALSHMEKFPTQDTRTSSFIAFARASEAWAHRGSIEDMLPTLEAARPHVTDYVAQAQAPFAYYWAYRMTSLLCNCYALAGNNREAFSAALEAIALRKREIALTQSREDRVVVASDQLAAAQIASNLGERIQASDLRDGAVATVGEADIGDLGNVAIEIVPQLLSHLRALATDGRTASARNGLMKVRDFILSPGEMDQQLRRPHLLSCLVALLEVIIEDEEQSLSLAHEALTEADALYAYVKDASVRALATSLRSALVDHHLDQMKMMEGAKDFVGADIQLRMAVALMEADVETVKEGEFEQRRQDCLGEMRRLANRLA